MATYCTKFIPNFSDTSEPLRELTKEDAKFQWSERHEQSFNKINELLASAKVMAYFDPNKETELVTDASPSGLSAILMQNTPLHIPAELLLTLKDAIPRQKRKH